MSETKKRWIGLGVGWTAAIAAVAFATLTLLSPGCTSLLDGSGEVYFGIRNENVVVVGQDERRAPDGQPIRYQYIWDGNVWKLFGIPEGEGSEVGPPAPNTP